MPIDNGSKAGIIRKKTKVLFRNKTNGEYLLTNEAGPSAELLRIFSATADGRIGMEGILLGSLFAHDPYLIPNLERMDCAFEELNPRYFDRDPAADGFIGLAAGDAFGVPVEFIAREEVRKLDLREMVGNDTPLHFSSRWGDMIPAGAWSDDTSMAYAAMASIIARRGQIDYDDIMKQFIAWWDEGKYASLSFPFGLGTNVSHALNRYRQGTPALECGGKNVMDNGNGALMRMFPFSAWCIAHCLSADETLTVIRNAAGMTHGHEINAMSCFLYTLFLDECVRTKNPETAYRNAVLRYEPYCKRHFSEEAVRAHQTLFTELGASLFNPDSIPQSGYVVDSLMTAIHSILRTVNYEDAVRTAVSFGYDTDTNGAITGSIAGAMYGRSQIPGRWLDRLRKKDELILAGRRFSRCIAKARELVPVHPLPSELPSC